MGALVATDYKQPKQIVETNSCIQVGDLNHYNYDEMNRVYSKEGCSPTLNTMQGGDRQPRVLEQNEAGVVENFRVRKLTPCECMKLMGFTEEDCANAKNIGIADSQLYKQSGNGIVTNCVELLAEHLYKAQYDNTYKCTDENFI